MGSSIQRQVVPDEPEESARSTVVIGLALGSAPRSQLHLQQFADETGLKLVVRPYPPGTQVDQNRAPDSEPRPRQEPRWVQAGLRRLLLGPDRVIPRPTPQEAIIENGPTREDGRNLLEEAVRDGYVVIRTRRGYRQLMRKLPRFLPSNPLGGLI